MNRDFVLFTQLSFIVLVTICLSGCYMEILGAGVGGAMWVADKITGSESPPKAYAQQLGTVYVTSNDAYIHYNDKDVKTTVTTKMKRV